MAVQQVQSSFSGRDFWLRVTVEDLQQDIPNNRTQIRKRLLIVRQPGENRNPSGVGAPYSYTVNGVTQSGTFSYNMTGESQIEIHTATQWVSHNSDGTKTVLVSANAQANAGGQVMGTASFTNQSIVLPKIDRGFLYDDGTDLKTVQWFYDNGTDLLPITFYYDDGTDLKVVG